MENFNYKIISSRREELEISQETLAKIVGVSTKTISNWEKGESSPDCKILPVLAKSLNLKVKIFFNHNKSKTKVLKNGL